MQIKKILFSQPQPTTAHNPYSRLEEQYGVECDFYQFIHIEGLTAREFRQQHINPLDYSAVILNSRLGAEHYFRLCEEMRLNVPDSMHYYCNSEQVGLYLQKYIQYRKRKVFFPETGNRFEDLLPAMHRRPNERYLMVLSDIHSDDQLNMFAENDIVVKPAIMYRTVTTPWPADKAFDYDIIALFTPAGVKALRENFPDWQQGDTLIAAFGSGTINALLDNGFRVDIEAGQGYKFASLPMAIADYLDNE
ncbi:MAG: uroporphyrinogen-III synthase [Paludibacteraceae bacterium]|nr:uroporphyrinogen-III synthase [Paludibacteraceae bacterium]MBQ9296888.1 uroporphyrinogen-III synthase [Paludibacteraceae bacterium]